MRILCISPYFPPCADSEAYCGGKMALALMDQGAEVVVLSMSIRQPATTDPSKLWDRLKPHSFLIAPERKRNWFESATRALRLRMPIYARSVGRATEMAAQFHAQRPFNVVYSRSLPFCAHVAGYWISRNLRLPWIANLNDPWDLHVFPENPVFDSSPFSTIASNYWLRRTLRCADVLTFPCRRLAFYTARMGKSLARIETIPHVGWRNGEAKMPPVFTLVHAGKLGMHELTGRSTRSLLTAVRKFLDRFPGANGRAILKLVGRADPETTRLAEELRLGGVVRQTGWVSYEESLAHIGTASACILIEGPMREGIFLPSKLVDYLVAGKPVLALSPEIGTVEDMSTDPGVIRLDASDENGIADAIGRLYQAHTTGCLEKYQPTSTLVRTFGADLVALRFLRVASRLLPEHGTPVRVDIPAFPEMPVSANSHSAYDLPAARPVNAGPKEASPAA